MTAAKHKRTYGSLTLTADFLIDGTTRFQLFSKKMALIYFN
jgi:hypothetical protein